MQKRIVTREELAAPKLKGLAMIAGIVKRTLGPGGLPIVIQRIGQSLDGSPLGPKITKDGVSVAEECASPDEAEDVVIQAVKAICKKTNTIAGDGTTTAIVLGEALVVQTEKALKEDPSLNPQLVKESIEEAAKEVLKKLKKAAIPIKNNDMIKQVASISANGDLEIGEIIGKAFEHVGVEGVVTVDEGQTQGLTLDMVDGYQFNRGAEGRDVFFNNQNGTQFEAENAAIIIYDGKILNHGDIIPFLKILGGAQNGPQGEVLTKKIPPFIIMANEFSPQVLQFLLIQKTEMSFQCCAIQGPNTTHVRSGYYDDLAIYTGATRLGAGARNLLAVEEDDIGFVDKIIVDKYKTTLYQGQGSEDELLKRVDQLKAMKERAESPYDVQILNDRIASLTNGVAKIGVGGITELEIKEKYDRIEDALNASRAAIQEGVVPGGGTTLLRISNELDSNKSIGHRILKEALKAPFLQILENIGLTLDVDSYEYQDILNSKKKVYDARDKSIKNALRSGIIDPVKVTRTALENAVSISSLLSTAGGAIIFVKDDV